MASQVANIDDTIARHSRSKSVDDGVADLLDRSIHHEMEQVRHEMHIVHQQARRQELDLNEHVIVTLRTLHQIRRELHLRLTDAELGYERDYAILTGMQPRSHDGPQPFDVLPLTPIDARAKQ